MTAETILAELRQLGVEVVAVGDKIRWRPKEAVPDELRTAIIRHKPELLAALTGPPLPAVRLYPETVAEVLGADPAPADLAAAQREVAEAVEALSGAIAARTVSPRLRLVRGRPLADWLDLATVAALLRAWRDRTARP